MILVLGSIKNSPKRTLAVFHPFLHASMSNASGMNKPAAMTRSAGSIDFGGLLW